MKNPNLTRRTIMKAKTKIAAAVIATLGLGLAAGAAQAHPQSWGGAMGPGMMHRMHGGMGYGPMGYGPAAGQQLMTPEERTALSEKMRAAATPEERQKLFEANQAEMQKRAKEKGATLPEQRGPGRGYGHGYGHGMHGAMGYGPMHHGPMGYGPRGQGMGGFQGGPGAGQQFMTPEEHAAMREKMRAAATPEERQKLAEANHAEMQKRAKEKGVTLPETRGPGRGYGRGYGPGFGPGGY